MKKLTKSLIGATIKCGEEWYSGWVYYVDVYQTKNGEYKAKRKVYVNAYTNKIEKESKDAKIFVPFGFERSSESDLPNDANQPRPANEESL